MHQETFAFPLLERFQAKDYIVGLCNQNAWQWLQSWPDMGNSSSEGGGSTVRITLLVGEKSSGKSHLASIWAERMGAEDLRARVDVVLVDSNFQQNCTPQDIPLMTSNILEGVSGDGVYLFEDVWDWIEPSKNQNLSIHQSLKEQILFHLYNHIVANGSGSILFTASTTLGESPLGLPDLRSRLGTAYAVLLEQPDDATLEAVYKKLFQDRQLAVPDTVISYLKVHGDRQFASIKSLVDRIDGAALQGHKAVTVGLVRDVLQQYPLGIG